MLVIKLSINMFAASKTIVFGIIFSVLTKLCFAEDLDPKKGEISKTKCKEYSKYVSESYQCPFSQTNELTVGGSYALEQEFPHTVILGEREKDGITWLCTGSLISEQFVLIAAHCLKNYVTINDTGDSDFLVRLGIINLNDSDHVQDFKIKEVVLHPTYKPSAVYDDIALLKLEKKVDINEYTRPACLFTKEQFGFDKAINSGWHKNYYGDDEMEEKLFKAVLEIYSEDRCKEKYNRPNKRISNGITYETMVCAGTKDIITAQPVTGGPLEVYHKEGDVKCMYDIIGVASFGSIGNFFKKDVPDVYTRVSAYIPWIETVVWK